MDLVLNPVVHFSRTCNLFVLPIWWITSKSTLILIHITLTQLAFYINGSFDGTNLTSRHVGLH